MQISGLCSIAGGRFGSSSGLSPLLGARKDANKMYGLGFSLIKRERWDSIKLVDSQTRNEVYDKIIDWVSTLNCGVAILYIGTHGFQTKDGMVFQFVDSIASCREYTGISLKDIYKVLCTSSTKFIVLIDCCRKNINSNIESGADFHPENVFVIYSCGIGEAVEDSQEGLVSIFRRAISHSITKSKAELELTLVFKHLNSLLEEKGRKFLSFGSFYSNQLEIPKHHSNIFETSSILTAFECRTKQLTHGVKARLESKCRNLENELGLKLKVNSIDQTPIMVISVDDVKAGSLYTLTLELLPDNIESMTLKYLPKHKDYFTRKLVSFGFALVSKGDKPLYTFIDGDTQQRVFVSDELAIFSFFNLIGEPISLTKTGKGIYQVIASMERDL